MARILLLIVLVWILYQIFKRVFAKAQQAAEKNAQNSDKNRSEKMLLCARCGCHVPESETRIIHEEIICNNPECSKLTHGD